MALLKAWPKLSLNLMVFAVTFSGAPGITWIEPPNPVTILGGTLVVKCSTDCDQPLLIGLETQLGKTPEDNGTRWRAFRLKNITQDSLLLCFANCNDKGQMLHSTNVTVIQPPEHVKLELPPRWILVGQNFTLRCQVWGGKPRQNLTLALLRGSQELSRQAVSEQDPRKVAEVTFTATARIEDHGVNFSCRAELDLQPQRLGLYQKSSAPMELHTFGLGTPRLTSPKLLEVGKEENVSCEIDELFPVENAQIHLSLGGRSLSSSVTRSQDMLRATAIAAIEEGDREGQWELTCIVTLGDQNREGRENLTIYSFPLPKLVISEPNVSEGTLVNVTCEARTGAKVYINGTLQSPGEIAQLSLKVTEEHDGSWITCQAVLEVLGEQLWRNKSQKLLVQCEYCLLITNSLCCPGRLGLPGLSTTNPVFRWPTAGRGQVSWELELARGDPADPAVQSRWKPHPSSGLCPESDQRSLPLGVPLKVSRAHGGRYRCTATSHRGQAAKYVTVTIEKSPRDSVPVIMGVLLVVGLAVLAGTIAALCLRQSKRRGSYEPQKRRGSYEPQKRRGSYEPQMRRGSYEPQKRRGSYEPQMRRGSFELQMQPLKDPQAD
ncbi:intercellular adhesion molecule 3-like [Antechinus flavipes]|uniref:intercellular adhesion molecule 3-like n=1 Tax=Antechinus flavipes TaxID=38775 RepID=UPI0022358050|nr:intercellular adhesion molecule 3-like [Antechinus flavipes]